MKDYILKIPLPISGLMLGILGLGNLLMDIAPVVRNVCGIIGTTIALLLIIKTILDPGSLIVDLKIPVLASVSGTFPMSLMLISGYIKPYIGELPSLILWFIAIIMHVSLMPYFTIKFMRKPDMNNVYASYFIVYVGIVIASVTSPIFERRDLGEIIFWFGLVTFFLLLVFIGYRYIRYRPVEEPFRPLFCIMAAPANLCLAGYMHAVEHNSIVIISILGTIGAILYLMVLIRLPSLLKIRFYPSYSAFTFPFVITALALQYTFTELTEYGYPTVLLHIIYNVQIVIAVVFVTYVFIRYVIFLISLAVKEEKQNID